MDCIDKRFVGALFTEDYYRAYEAVERYVSKAVLSILDDLRISEFLRKDFRTVDEILAGFNLHPQSKPILGWALKYLEQTGSVQGRGPAYRMNSAAPGTDAGGDVRRILDLMPSAEIFIKLVEHIKADMGNFMHGRKSGGDMLFAGAAAGLWNDYFNNRFYGYSVLNYGAAYGITKWFSRTGGKRMLEIGSGTSGATVKVFGMLRDNNLLDSMDSIVLTDVVAALLEAGRRNISANAGPPPVYGQRVLDINKPFSAQGFAEGSFDIIFGVNVMHVARDLEFSLKEIHGRLNKDGMLVISETTRPSENRAMHHEIIFNLLENYYDVKTLPGARPCHGFLTREMWIKNLESAGFKDIEFITELERHDGLDFDIGPLHSFLVIKGQK